jgi:hypothetical protein
MSFVNFSLEPLKKVVNELELPRLRDMYDMDLILRSMIYKSQYIAHHVRLPKVDAAFAIVTNQECQS